MVAVSLFRSEERDEWNAFNREARTGHFLFDRDYMEYHNDRFIDNSLVFRNERQIIGLLPANRSESTVYSHQGLTFGGLVHQSSTSTVMRMLDAASEMLRSQGVKRLVYKPLPYIYHARPAQEDLYWLFRSGATLTRRDISSALSYSNPGKISQRRRRGGGKAEKAGLIYREISDRSKFWTVLTEVLAARHDVRPVHTLAEIDRLADQFPDNIRQFVAMLGDDVVAGVLMFNNHPCAHAQYIASNQVGRGIGALDGLFLYLIDVFRSEDFMIFDFGISTEEQGRKLNEGLIVQKEEFGASAVVYDTYIANI